MPFDSETRNLLARIVARCRDTLATDVEAQLQSRYGLYPDGRFLNIAQTTDDHQSAQDLKDLLDHLTTNEPAESKKKVENAYQRLVREIGFTTLNRLAALRLGEERGIVIQCVGKGMASDGFQLYDRLANGALGNRYQTYRVFIESLYDELAMDLGVLFDRDSPHSHVFPSEAALTEVLAHLNDSELEQQEIWIQDETVGWIYQYYNDPDERRAMRRASSAPRNSRELAVRNQFFTPRYVVEFLTDNTLGRIWYEMRKGQTRLVEECRYLVRRPVEIFLSDEYFMDRDPALEKAVEGDFSELPDNPDWQFLSSLALMIDGYDLAPKFGLGECGDLANQKAREYQETGRWHGSSIELWICLFFEQRRWRHFGHDPEGEAWEVIQALYQALLKALHQEPETTDQETLLQQPVYIGHRPIKDPRDIKILDPACGSGHFLLYSFDLLKTIYEEAYEQPNNIPPSNESDQHLGEDFPNLDDLRLAVPELILRHNLNGIDIDPRAVQIAALTLWLRAQRNYQLLELEMSERPRIRRSNVVTAEPLAGDRDQLDKFVAALDKDSGKLVSFVFEALQAAGELGSLLRIEKELREEIQQLQEGLDPFKTLGQDYWSNAKDIVLESLEHFTSQITDNHLVRRRLFAEDASQGLAFIEICNRNYDIILMNPPFGKGSRRGAKYLSVEYPTSGTDEVCASFYTRAFQLLNKRGLLGAITTRTPFFLFSLAEWRRKWVFGSTTLRHWLDLGEGILDDATNETAAYVVYKGRIPNRIASFGMYHREKNKEDAIKSYVSGSRKTYFKKLTDFEILADKPLCYWVSNNFIRQLRSLQVFGTDIAEVQMGLAPRNEFRFSRLWWEIAPQEETSGDAWLPYAKGGELTPYYSDVELVLRASDDLAEIKASLNQKYPYLKGNLDWVLHPENRYFDPGLTFGQRTTFLRVSVLPRGSYFSVAGKGIFGRSINNHALLQLINTPTAQYLISLRRERLELDPQYQEGDVARMPWPSIPQKAFEPFEHWGIENYKQTLSISSYNEVDHSFGGTIDYTNFKNTSAKAEETVRNNQQLADKSFSDLLELSDQDKVFIQTEILPRWHHRVTSSWFTLDIADVWQYAVGCIFGRWDIRITLNPTLAPQFPPPFGSLPVLPPAALVDRMGQPASSGQIVSERWMRSRNYTDELSPDDSPEGDMTIPDSDYEVHILWSGILVDDPGLKGKSPHPNDVIERVRSVMERLWPDNHQLNEAEVNETLNVRDPRDYFRNPNKFFAFHLKRYS